MKVVIYSKSNCPFCEKAKAWFIQHDHQYTEIKLDDEEQRMAFYQKYPNVRSVPQIFINDKHIGTYNDFMSIANALVKKQGGLLEFSDTYKPFHYPWAVEVTTRHEKAHWIEDELDLSEDVSDWKGGKISQVEKDYITNILRLFTQSDVAVEARIILISSFLSSRIMRFEICLGHLQLEKVFINAHMLY